jgi:cytochrome c oxidase assembly protein subunit 15
MVANVLMAMAALQVALGITTLLLVVPVYAAATHQAGAVLLFTMILWFVHELRGTAQVHSTRSPGFRN